MSQGLVDFKMIPYPLRAGWTFGLESVKLTDYTWVTGLGIGARSLLELV